MSKRLLPKNGLSRARPLAARWQRRALLALALAWGLSGAGSAWAQPAAEAPAPTPRDAPTPAPTDAGAQGPSALDRALDELRKQQRDTVDLRMRLASAESAAAWLPWLLLGLVSLGGLAVWLGLRVRRLQHEKSRRDWAAAEAELHATLMPEAPRSGPSPLAPGDAPLLSPGPAGGLTAPPAPDLQAVAPAPRERQPEPSRAERTLSPLPDTTPRAVTVEEMLDLEQQVDFFLVLGQEQAAVDLLLGHVRSTGGINAMPYLKLLEIYRQQGDEEAFERTRERFNQRFNAVAPPFADELGAGRHLEDYPALVARLQRAWPQPMRALAELDGLLLRRSDLDPLDLPAFHDLLTLHALVRDLPAGPARASAPVEVAQASPSMSPAMAAALAAARAGLQNERTQTLISARTMRAEPEETIDLLLPLEAEPLDTTQPRPRLTEPGQVQAMVVDWMQARSTMRSSGLGLDTGLPAEPVSRSSRLDLDLTELGPPPREFTRPGAFTDAALRRDTRPSDLSPFDDSDLLPPSMPRR